MAPTRLLSLVLLLFACLGRSDAAQSDPDDRWSERFTRTGLTTRVFGLGTWQDRLVAGGQTFQSRGRTLDHVAVFDGVGWQPLGEGVSGTVRAVCEYGGDLVVAGRFSAAGGKPASGVARWDGQQWHPLGEGLELSYAAEPRVFALAVYDGELYAGGLFDRAGGKPVRSLARWDGTQWRAAGGDLDGPYEPTVFALHVHAGKLIAGGDFQTAAGVPVQRVAAWDGGSWVSLGAGIPGAAGTRVESLETFGGDLHVGGNFSQAGGTSARCVARWNGGSWSALGSGIPDWTISVSVPSLEVFDGALYVGGDFVEAGGVPSRALARWTGSAWEGVGGVEGSDLATTVLAMQAWNGRLAVGGEFDFGGPTFEQDDVVVSNGVIAFDGADYAPLGLGLGLNGAVDELLEFAGGVVAVGGFFEAGTELATRVAFFDGGNWRTLGDFDDAVKDAVVFEGELVVTGRFDHVDGQPIRGTARFDGASWQPMGQLGGDVLAVYEGELYKGGLGQPIVWDGSGWQSLTSQTEIYGQVNAMVEHEGLLWIGGYLNLYVQPGPHLVTWDGQAFAEPPGGTPDDAVDGLESLGGALYVGGRFASIGGVPAANVARWDGASYQALGEGLPGQSVFAFGELAGDLYAGGNFTPLTGAVSEGIARWTGVAWEALGSGVGGAVFALLADSDEERLWVGGGFHDAGGKPAAFLTRWHEGLSPAGVPFCFGDEGACPCGNAGRADGGCANGAGPGARLRAFGSTSLAEDDLTLESDGLPPKAFALAFGGTGTRWEPAAFGDGTLCVAGDLTRIPPVAQADDAGTIVRSAFAGLADAAIPGGVLSTVGATWHFQDWYRDSAGPCGSSYNATNAVSLTFLP